MFNPALVQERLKSRRMAAGAKPVARAQRDLVEESRRSSAFMPRRTRRAVQWPFASRAPVRARD